MKESVRSVWN